MERFLGYLFGYVALLGGLLFALVMPILLGSLIVRYLRTGRSAVGLFISSVIVVGFFVGGILSWYLIPFHWNVPFWTTVKASVDAETYGHPFEHRAEGTLIWTLFGAVCSAVLSGTVAATAAKLRTRLRHA
jgi:hypothetical protein